MDKLVVAKLGELAMKRAAVSLSFHYNFSPKGFRLLVALARSLFFLPSSMKIFFSGPFIRKRVLANI